MILREYFEDTNRYTILFITHYDEEKTIKENLSGSIKLYDELIELDYNFSVVHYWKSDSEQYTAYAILLDNQSDISPEKDFLIRKALKDFVVKPLELNGREVSVYLSDGSTRRIGKMSHSVARPTGHWFYFDEKFWQIARGEVL